MKRLFAPAAVLALLGATSAMAEPVAFDFDPSHSRAVFDYKHLGFSTSTGIINGVAGDLTLNGVTKPVVLEVELNQRGPHPMAGQAG
ncbi:YceI family protein [Paracoccus sp. (in: a-proteobacteria)]|uniref:YceI family protein n=1 Tax=Paracoccus sp. TaxID=267 RepID=UPI00321F9E71